MDLSVLGITPRKEKQFNSKDIYSVEDLLNFLPRKYNDCTKITGLLPDDQLSCVVLKVRSVEINYKAKVDTMIAKCQLVPTGERVTIFWFHQNFHYEQYCRCQGKDVYVVGKAKYSPDYDSYTIFNPDIFDCHIKDAMKIYPIYSKIKNMSNDYLVEKIEKASRIHEAYIETLPPSITKPLQLYPIERALYQMHFPSSRAELTKAEQRLIFDELLAYAMEVEKNERECPTGSAFSVKTLELYHSIRHELPYTLTEDQDKAVKEILEKASPKNGKRINALVQGDVGCGKTIVAMLIMAAFAGSGYQALLMAPTQVLARQHYEDLQNLVSKHGYKVVYLGSELKISERKKVLKQIASGEAQFIVGTQAVVGKDVEYHNLACAVIDEEHKFGVEQRNAVIDKAMAGVHRITMSATPIPRSLSIVMYGNTMEMYTIKSMPKGRKPVKTGIAKNRASIYGFLLSQIKQGHQAYIVCPMVEKNEEIEGVQSVEEIEAEYGKALKPYGVRFATLTGKDKKEQLEATIESFKNGEIDVLIATTVVEVGVNVPNATAMVITNAERFGLSSLHQLRGRVGRNSLQSYCILESEMNTEKAKRRLEVMCKTTSGFEIAKEDLDIRGAGDFLGTRQSGENKILPLILAYEKAYNCARKIACHAIDNGWRLGLSG